MKIRRAKKADLPSLGRLGALLVEVHHAFDAERFLAPGDDTAERYADFLGSQLRSSDVVILVAEDPAGVIGYAYGAVEGPDFVSLRGAAGLLHDLMVDPTRRRQGIGKLLTRGMLGELRALGARQVVLATASPNHPARQLFASLGFRSTMVEMTTEL